MPVARGAFVYLESEMRNDILIIDGHDPKEAGEIDLVRAVAGRKFDAVVSGSSFLPVAPPIKRWGVVWFGGHVTHWKSAGKCNLERREGSRYHKIMAAEDALNIDTDVLVLSACNTNAFEWPIFRSHKAKMLIGYKGVLNIDDAIIFAAAFMTRLIRTAKYWVTTPTNVAAAFEAGCRATRDIESWGLHYRDGV